MSTGYAIHCADHRADWGDFEIRRYQLDDLRAILGARTRPLLALLRLAVGDLVDGLDRNSDVEISLAVRVEGVPVGATLADFLVDHFNCRLAFKDEYGEVLAL
jgi:hypothetical protein